MLVLIPYYYIRGPEALLAPVACTIDKKWPKRNHDLAKSSHICENHLSFRNCYNASLSVRQECLFLLHTHNGRLTFVETKDRLVRHYYSQSS
jgi:hypothetical protein